VRLCQERCSSSGGVRRAQPFVLSALRLALLADSSWLTARLTGRVAPVAMPALAQLALGLLVLDLADHVLADAGQGVIKLTVGRGGHERWPSG
jgi:hypothetical protein